MPAKKTSTSKSKAKKTTPKKTTPKKSVQQQLLSQYLSLNPLLKLPLLEAEDAPDVASAPSIEDQFSAINAKIAQLGQSLESEIQSDLQKLHKSH